MGNRDEPDAFLDNYIWPDKLHQAILIDSPGEPGRSGIYGISLQLDLWNDTQICIGNLSRCHCLG